MSGHNKIWRIPKPNLALQEIFSLKLGVTKVVAQILVNRGISTLDEARNFLSSETALLHDPFILKDMEKAVRRVMQAVGNGESIRIFGDYDVDGITSTSIMYKVLKTLGAKVDFYIPARLTEGYGMNSEAIKVASCAEVSLIITVDCGITAIEEVDLAKELGVDVIITDHHETPEKLPTAVAIINPKQRDCPYVFKDLAGAGVAFKFAQALLGADDIEGLGSLTELACLGTIADVVPLKGENRILVKKGLKLLADTDTIGIRALIDKCGIEMGNINSHNIAYQLAPRINAAGRLGDATVGVKLLLSENIEEAESLAEKLCLLNEERQKVEAGIHEEALKLINREPDYLKKNKVIVLASDGLHLGVMGIVASRLIQDFYRPVVLLSIDGDTAKGSARSIPTFNIFEAFNKCEEYLARYGGHKQAAGLTIPVENISTFAAAMNQYAELLTEEDLLPEIYIDSVVDFEHLNEKLYQQLQMLAPYGCDNASPVLACRNASVLESRTVGSDGKHLKMKISDGHLVFEGIGFSLGSLHNTVVKEEKFDVVFALDKNEWNGRSTLQLNVKDFKPGVANDMSFKPVYPQGNAFIEELFQNAVTYLTDDFYRDIADREEFYTKVAGVTFENRQGIVRGLDEGEKLKLVREPNNEFDSNAVRVETGSGIQVGYLNAKLARHFAPLLDRGDSYETLVSQVTGGNEKNYGVNIVIQKARHINGEDYLIQLCRLREQLGGLPDHELMEKIREALLGGNPYRDKQLETLEHLFAGSNTLAVFGTGRGKSAVFQSTAAYRALRIGELTIVVYPLRALVNDQFENMSNRLEKLGLRVYRGNGSISALERALLFEALEKEEIDILLTTPEFVAHHMKRLRNMRKKVGFFVVDESHHIGMASQAHRPLYKRLGELAQSVGKPTVLAVTATADEKVTEEIIETLNIEKVVIDPHVRTNLQLIDKRDCRDKHGYLRTIVSSRAKTIIYVNSRLQTVELGAMLREAIPQMVDQIVFYHAGLTSEQRNKIEKMFRTGEVNTVVSTSAFGEGIDIPDVKNVVVFHLNFNFTEFNQQCGRCGRDGDTANIHIVCGRRDAALNQFILEASSPDRDVLAKMYSVLKQATKEQEMITLTNDELAQLLKAAEVRYAKANMVSACLGILEELELIRRETMGRERQISLLPTPREKIAIEKSLRFTEGQDEKKAFFEFQDYFFKAGAEELLSFINSPIYPEKYLNMQYCRKSYDIIK